MFFLRKKWGLRRKLVGALLLVGLLPINIGLVTSYFSQKSTLTENQGHVFEGVAKETSLKFSLLLQELVIGDRLLASDPVLQESLGRANKAYLLEKDPDMKLRAMEARWVRGDQNFRNRLLEPKASAVLKADRDSSNLNYVQLLLVDRQGGLVAASNPPRQFRYRDETWWKAGLDDGRGAVFIGDIQWDAEVNRYTLPIAVPVHAEGEMLGLLLAIHKVDRPFKSVTDVHITLSDHTMLANSSGDLLFCPIFQIKNHTLNKDFIQKIAQPQPGWAITQIDVHYPGRDAVNGFSPVQLQISGLSPESFGGQKWFIFTSQDPKVTYGPLQTLLGWTVLSSALGLGIVIILTVLISRRIITPIRSLQETAQTITKGIQDLSVPAQESMAGPHTKLPAGALPNPAALEIDAGDEIEELARSFSDMTEALVRTQQQVVVTTKRLEEMAITDELTGLYNRRFFWEIIKDEYARTLRFNLDLSCLMIDIDFFKLVNDRHGHQAGDEVLRDLAHLLFQSCRETDTLARFGGEEFVAILPQTDTNGALVQAERLRRQVEAHSFKIDADQTISLTVSIGVASYPDDRIKGIEDLVKIADDALYYSKQKGRNKTTKG